MATRTIIFKAIELCNANCIYCDVIKKHQTHKMDFTLLETVFERMNEFLMKHPNETIEFLWHGGEVCLLGADYFKRALDIQNRICPETGSRIQHSIQSNLTLINQDIIDAFWDLGIRDIGTSYDLDLKIRGIGPSRDVRKYNEMFFKGLELLRDNNILGSVIYVVHQRSLANPVEIFYHLCNIFYDSSVQFNIINVYGEDRYNLKITQEEFAHFIGQIFTEWWKHKYTLPQMSSFRSYYYALKENNFHASCGKTGRCTYRWLYIDPEGNVKHCCQGEHCQPIYGHIRKNTLEELYFQSSRDQLVDRYHILPQTECKGCRYWKVCHGGCVWGAKIDHDDFNRKYHCKTTKIFLEQYFEPVTGMRFEI